MRNRKVIVAYDCPCELCQKKWVHLGLQKAGYDVVPIYANCDISQVEFKSNSRAIIIILLFALRIMMQSRRGDIVVCWSQRSGLFANLWGGILRGRSIVSFGWLNPPINSRSVKLYSTYLNNTNNIAIMNSIDNITNWQQLCNISNNERMFCIPDVIDEQEDFAAPNMGESSPYIFCGGASNRDWPLLLEVARTLSNVKFILAMPENDWDSSWSKTDNVEVRFGVKLDDYYDTFSRARLIVLPLREPRVSGLVNIISAARLGKFILVTDIDATRSYFPEKLDNHLIPLGDKDMWISRINEALRLDIASYDGSVRLEQKYIKDHFSSNRASAKLNDIIVQILE